MAELIVRRDGATGWIVFSNPAKHNAVTYEMIRAALGDPGHKELRELQAAIDACHGSEDYEEGRAAFGEKRKPQFKGR